MTPQLLKLLNLGFTGPILIRMADGRKLQKYQRTALRVIGLTTIALNAYGLWVQYQATQNKPLVDQLVNNGP